MKTAEEIRLEARALSAALGVVEGGQDPTLARESCELFLRRWAPDDSLESKVILTAASMISGREVPRHQISGSTELSTTSRRWVTWALGGTPSEPWFSVKGPSRFDALAIHQWSRAIDLLSEGHVQPAKRWFDRATKISSEYATESNALIHWAFVATFFPY